MRNQRFYDPYSGEDDPSSEAASLPTAPDFTYSEPDYQNQTDSPDFDPYGGIAENPVPEPEEKEVPDPAANPIYQEELLGGRAKPKDTGVIMLVLIIASLLIATVLLVPRLFPLRNVRVIVESNAEDRTVSDQEIVNMTGLTYGQNMLVIQESDVRPAFSGSSKLVFLGMEKNYGNKTITIRIRERKCVAAYRYLGVAYLLDKDCMVMAETSIDAIPSSLPIVIGFHVTSINVGQEIRLSSSSQKAAYVAIMKEMKADDHILQINLSDPEQIYLLNRENISIRLSTAEYMHAKFMALRLFMDALPQGTTGEVDLTIPEMMKFSPDH